MSAAALLAPGLAGGAVAAVVSRWGGSGELALAVGFAVFLAALLAAAHHHYGGLR